MYEWFNLREVPRQGSTDRAAAASAQVEPEAVEDEATVNEPLSAKGFPGFRYLDYTHPYFDERGLSEETIEYFGIGFHGGKGMMAQRVVIPIHNAEGELVAYVGRWPGHPPEDTPKYLLPPRFRKQLEVFNLHRVPATKQVVLVEGYFDVMRLHQCGWPNTVATMGVSVSKRQIELLASKFRGVHILFDGDETGRKAGNTVAAKLSEHVWVRVARCPLGTQPEHLSEAQLKEILR
jgi:DNA primase